jgi:hypothetical protein
MSLDTDSQSAKAWTWRGSRAQSVRLRWIARSLVANGGGGVDVGGDDAVRCEIYAWARRRTASA